MKEWDRRPNESDVAWTAFQAFRDAGPTRGIHQAAGTGAGTAKKRRYEAWSSANQWVARAHAYDVYLDQVAQAATAKARADMARRHALLGQDLQAVASKRLKGLKATAENLKGSEVAALAKAGVDIERVATGEPTEIKETRVSDESRARLRGIFGDEEAKP